MVTDLYKKRDTIADAPFPLSAVLAFGRKEKHQDE
jgi:hypothetical protein